MCINNFSLQGVAPTQAELGQLVAMLNAGCYAELEASMLAHIEKFPNSGFAWKVLGVAYRAQGKNALEAMEQATKLLPKDAEAHFNLGNALQALAQLENAKKNYLRALELKPDYAEAQNNLGNTLKNLWQQDAAITCYRRALQIKPTYADAYNNLAIALMELGYQDDAEMYFRQAILSDQNFVEARWRLVMNQIPLVAESEERIGASRANFQRELAQLDAWFDTARSVVGHEAVGTSQPFYLAYQEEDNCDLLSRYGSLCSRLMKSWQDSQTIPSVNTEDSTAIRVGIVSAHLHSHSVWSAIIKGWIQHLNRERIELHLYHVGSLQDEETLWAKSRCAHFEQRANNLQQWTASILKNQDEVLIYPEVGMDPMTAQLASLRLAPIQIAAWGHPETTGLPTMDYYLSAECLEPEKAQHNYTEKLVRLPNLGCHYTPPEVTSSNPDYAELGINPNVPLLLCPGTPYKYSPKHDHVLVEIAQRLGRCQFIFFSHQHRQLSEKLEQRLKKAFEYADINFSDYCLFIPWQDKSAFYGLMKRADVMLDTIGFSGFNTALQAIECDLPIVTREGRFMRGRLAGGILQRMGLDELITSTEKEYVELAVKLVQDAGYQQDIRLRILTARHVLFDDVEPIRALEDFIVEKVMLGRKHLK